MIRQAKESDIGFIYSSYLKSLRSFKSAVSNELYYKHEHDRMEWLLKNGVTAVLVDDEDHDHILGWCNAVIEPGQVNLSYVYIKHTFRRAGLARQLITAVLDAAACKSVYYSTYSTIVAPLIKQFNMAYNPYLFDYKGVS